MFPFSDVVYKWLKWICITVLPAIATLVGALGVAMNWEYAGVAVAIITALTAFLGMLIGVSGKEYSKNINTHTAVYDEIDVETAVELLDNERGGNNV